MLDECRRMGEWLPDILASAQVLVGFRRSELAVVTNFRKMVLRVYVAVPAIVTTES